MQVRCTNWKTFYHSCGAVAELIPDFIEMGVDILNPVQCSANGMDAQMLKDTYGKDIVFWGGGYVFTSIHNVVAKVPAENLKAMYDAVREFRGL